MSGITVRRVPVCQKIHRFDPHDRLSFTTQQNTHIGTGISPPTHSLFSHIISLGSGPVLLSLSLNFSPCIILLFQKLHHFKVAFCLSLALSREEAKVAMRVVTAQRYQLPPTPTPAPAGSASAIVVTALAGALLLWNRKECVIVRRAIHC